MIVKTWEMWVCNVEPLVAKAEQLDVQPNWEHLNKFCAELEQALTAAKPEPYIDPTHAITVETHLKRKAE